MKEKPDLNFHDDWFSANIPVWSKFLAHLKGKEYVNALEIGSWEGMSACWTINNILTDPSSRLTCVDTFQGNPENPVTKTDIDVEDTLRANIKATGAENRVEIIRQRSHVAMKYMHENHFDMIYIDGSHNTTDVLIDLCLAWPLLKHGGIMIMDDYEYFDKDRIAVPKIAIDAFQGIFRKELYELHRGWQMLWRKI